MAARSSARSFQLSHKLTLIPAGMPPGATYKIVDEDACHYFVTPDRFDGPVFRVPLRCVMTADDYYFGVNGFRCAPST